MNERKATPSLGEIAALSLWLGVAGFGGGYAVMQRARRAIVEKRRWLSEEELASAIVVATSLPGTVATHLLTLVGLRFGRVRGALLAATCFLAPSFALMVAFGAFYDDLRGLHALATFLDGMGYATVGVVAAVAVDLGRGALVRKTDGALAALACALLAFHVVGLFVVVVAAAAFGALAMRPKEPRAPKSKTPEPSLGPASLRAVALFFVPTTASLALFVVFAKIGIVTFGGGFAMIPALEREAVHDHAWLGARAFSDAMVLGQVTPGPVAIVSTFIGYRVDHIAGALAATTAMFGPPFVLCVLAGRSVEAFRDRAIVRGALRAVLPSVVGIIAASAVALFRTTVHGPFAGVVAACAFVVLVVKRDLTPLVPLFAAGVAALVFARAG
jgi:chromate transporter